ncbi:hypothetical protein BD289DRAFT_142722 [Coniella lustricola]|uniref:Uncharacterized protein n=1 Tax=Coniella lustricola TaxID=2025994 RepID=A0A2T2ZV55_9PEZI|nr:hypothetical protein BD289DRAFT_142722 [Coniella lustricola]
MQTSNFDPFSIATSRLGQPTMDPFTTFDPFAVTSEPFDPFTLTSSNFDPFNLTSTRGLTTLSTVTSFPSGSAPPAPSEPLQPRPTSQTLPSPTPSNPSGPPAAAGVPGSPCSPEGVFVCLAGDLTFQRCASGQWSVVMAVAAGSRCSQFA